MYFKRLELIGFKSFRDKTILEFEPGVTAIVGPNGCGKSNIADGIRWVLGEQSARDLRGSRMEDVIFNGTQEDEPLGLAEVSLTLSNETKILPIDFEEVTITRRLFRSGESEYLLNKIPVRLRDILELLMGTGIGQTFSSHIAQGKIDEMLSARPEDRRDPFEEASGITKFRTKKKEAMRRLEETETNLKRVGDILLEVSRQIGSLERQADRARRYQEQFERLKSLEQTVARHRMRAFGEKQEALMTQKGVAEKEEADVQGRRKHLAESGQRLSQDLTQIDGELSSNRAKQLELKAAIQDREGRIQLNRERMEELSIRQRQLKEEIALASSELKRCQAELEAAHKELSEWEGEAGKREEALSVLVEQLDGMTHSIAVYQETISRAKLEVVEIAQTQSRLKSELSKYLAQLQHVKARLRRLGLEKDKTQLEVQGLSETYRQAEVAFQTSRETLKALWEKRSVQQTQREAIGKELERWIQEMAKARESLSALQSKKDLLEEACRTHEGFSQGVKAVLKALDAKDSQLFGVKGVLAKLIQVKPGYEVALEVLLGPSVQALVVEEEKDALRCLEKLRGEELGRASFFILGHFSSHPQKPSIPTQGQIALECLSVAKEYAPLLVHLLSDGRIAQNFEEALLLQKKEGGRVATPAGELVEEGRVTGGSPPTQDLSLLNREGRLTQLQEDLEATHRFLEKASQKEESLRHAFREIEQSLQLLESDLHQAEVEVNNRQRDLSRVEEEKGRLEQELSLLTVEFSEMETEAKTLEEQERSLTGALRQAEEEALLLQETLTHSQQILTEESKRREESLVRMTEMKTELAALKDRRTQAERSFSILQSSEAEKRSSLEVKETETQLALSKGATLGQENERLASEKTLFASEVERLQEELVGFETKRHALAQSWSQFQETILPLDRQVDEIRQRQHTLELEMQQVGYEQSRLLDRLRMSYQMTEIEPAAPEEPPLDPTAQDQIDQLREKLERMGPVNLVAIEEHEELKSRYQFLCREKEDLEKAKASLLEAIQKIQRTARELFLSTFREIQTYFRDYFRLLFGGGEAEVLLLDEQDVLESGIEIMAHPPGKKPQTISLLSGGERALTAIALLFAIFKVKPSPFCVLDEIDAPLDEANTARFTSLLEDFLKTSQFIIVTHSKRTITMADVMYGITMQKTGVSKIVSVRFKEGNGEGNGNGQPAGHGVGVTVS